MDPRPRIRSFNHVDIHVCTTRFVYMYVDDLTTGFLITLPFCLCSKDSHCIPLLLGFILGNIFSYFVLKRGQWVVVRLNESVQTCTNIVSFEQRKKQSRCSDENVILQCKKSNLGYKVMRVNIMLQKSPFLQPRLTSKIFYTEMVNVNRKTLRKQTLKLSRVMRKLDFCICKNKGSDYLCS